jgi:geranylgeranyl diphosphate synthase, type I
MDFQQILTNSKAVLDGELERQFDTLIIRAKKESPLIKSALLQTKKIALAGGKRIRGILLQQAYFGVGGKEKRKILKVAGAIELLHLFFLIHDDLIDRGQLRHGQKTLQNFFTAKESRKETILEAQHFGNSVALIVGDLLFAQANRIILEAGFEASRTLAALSFLQEMVTLTIAGQAQDIAIEKAKSASESAVLGMYKNKTARYTFQMPLQLGAILAGTAAKKTQTVFKAYGLALGVAFQLQDDALGIFSQKEKIGKSTVSDIEEGKLSLLVVLAQAQANKEEKKVLREILGKRNLSQSEVQVFKDILIKNGARAATQKLAQAYFLQGKRAIEKSDLIQSLKTFLTELVRYLEKRES